MKDDIGVQYQQSTKYKRGHLPGGYLRWDQKPALYKQYPDVPRIKLPRPEMKGGSPIWDAMHARRSQRRFSEIPLSLSQLSQILWASQGITRRMQGIELRTAPSAGALYPVETYLSANLVADLHPGIYHYAVRSHSLEQLKKGDFRHQLSVAALDQKMCGDAAAVFIWTGVFERSMWKYRQRAFRYVYLDAGHIAQNLALAAQALGLGSCQIAALYDDDVNEIIGVHGVEESVIYMSVVGQLI
jgi:SagB-type dehydrogenase family enzyme